jgi:hypothetical protein
MGLLVEFLFEPALHFSWRLIKFLCREPEPRRRRWPDQDESE